MKKSIDTETEISYIIKSRAGLFGHLKEAGKMKNTIKTIDKVNAGAIQSAPQSFNVLLSAWINGLDGRDKTVLTYRKAGRVFMGWAQENGITNPTPADIAAYKQHLKTERRNRNGEPLKTTTINLYMLTVKKFFNDAAAYGFVNIATGIKTDPLDKVFRKDDIEPTRARELLDSIDRNTLTGKRDYAIIMLALTGGLRTVEIVRADIEDVTTKRGENVLKVHGKGREGKNDIIKLRGRTLAAINEYLAARRGAGELAPDAPLFAAIGNRNNGGRMNAETISHIVKARLRAIGIDDTKVTAHSLRHTAAVMALENGADLQEVSIHLRHSSTNVTRIYTHGLESVKNRSAQKIEDVLFKGAA